MSDLNQSQVKLQRKITSSLWFRLFMLKDLPMGLLAGLRIRQIDADSCQTTVPYKWLNKNPFNSTYFAVQSMAAELSTASPCLLAVSGIKPSVAFIIVDMKASFHKKATSRVTYSCQDGRKAFEAVHQAVTSGEAQVATFKTTGTMADGTVVSEFEFTWSFKQRSL